MTPMTIVDPNDLVGHTRFRARIVRAIEERAQGLAKEPERIKFLCAVNEDQFEEILSYNDLLSHLAEDDENYVWKFRRITAHQGPVTLPARQ
jgi:hypothetical protein